jgi:hypothetical protein
MRRLLAIALLLAAWASPAWAEGPQFNGNCSTFSWTARTESDLAGYRLYDRTSTSVAHTQILTLGPSITSVPCSTLGFNAGQHYVAIRAFDSSSNEGPLSPDIALVIFRDNQIADLRTTVINATDLVLAYTEVDDGTGLPATMDIRIGTPTINWGAASSVASGTCGSAVSGVTIGATRTCTVTGLATTTPYQFQGVPYRGTLGGDAVFGPLTNIADATTGGSPPSTGRVTVFSDGFDYANGSLPAPWQGGYNFSALYPSWQIVTGAVRAAVTGTVAINTYAGTSLPNDSWIEFTLKTLTGAGAYSPRLLLAFTAPPIVTGYEFKLSRGIATERSRLGRYINGALAQLSIENTTTWAAGDVARLERHGTELTVYRNDTIISALTVNDAAFNGGGFAGMMIFVDSGSTLANAEIESFRMGTFSAAATDSCGCN